METTRPGRLHREQDQVVYTENKTRSSTQRTRPGRLHREQDQVVYTENKTRSSTQRTRPGHLHREQDQVVYTENKTRSSTQRTRPGRLHREQDQVVYTENKTRPPADTQRGTSHRTTGTGKEPADEVILPGGTGSDGKQRNNSSAFLSLKVTDAETMRTRLFHYGVDLNTRTVSLWSCSQHEDGFILELILTYRLFHYGVDFDSFILEST
ncbi:uncharacterized protein LOC114829437 [Esox lucius]|uniref:uncharacterized protein LOC114829437 n=1 Tax=Esox lucius TaxID=8010 RepID=UPI001476955A|nr:uncharacterized protein LOC114829437 [Esox lucius]